MTDVVNPKSSSPDQLLPYHKKISAEDKVLMVYFISYTYMVLKEACAKTCNQLRISRSQMHQFLFRLLIFALSSTAFSVADKL